MIRMCDNCSNVDLEQLKAVAKGVEIEVGCMGQCGMHMDEASVLIDDELFVAEDETALLKVVQSKI